MLCPTLRVLVSECTVEEILCSIGHSSENVPCNVPYGTCLATAGNTNINVLKMYSMVFLIFSL